MKTKAFALYSSQVNSLISLIKETEKRTIESEDFYFSDNANFFCKSFLITTCTYLESYLKASASLIINEAEERLRTHAIAHNIIKWSIDKGNLKLFKYESFSLNISESDIDENVSGNIDRTLAFFRKLGLNLESEPGFDEKKDIIAPVIVKRNRIIHYNDDASDLSLGDIRGILIHFLSYMEIIDNCVVQSMHNCLTSPFYEESVAEDSVGL